MKNTVVRLKKMRMWPWPVRNGDDPVRAAWHAAIMYSIALRGDPH